MKLSIVICVLSLILFGTQTEHQNEYRQENDMEKIMMLAKVKSTDDELIVEVIRSEYTFGIHVVLTFEQTRFEDSFGREISLSEIKTGDILEIYYNGQVMMSYPPKIVAHRIVLHSSSI